ncbi:MAG TPA: plasmid pRiA4b ORF-3 family protein [Micromonospora sp.]|nr:plasmid pRiA4b ORF-3 family protein [Micromonospora sp.]
MSPVSRGRPRQPKKKSVRRPALPEVFDLSDACDCAACSGESFDVQEMIEALIAGGADLIKFESPLDAEIAGAMFISLGAIVGDGFEEVLLAGLIPEFEARATIETLALLQAITPMVDGDVGSAASAAAARLVEAGIPQPGWAAELGLPVTAGDCWRLSDSEGAGSMLVCSFHRAGRSHAIMVSVDHTDCGAAQEILLLDADQLPQALELFQADGRDSGLEITKEALDAAEFRWQVESALDARAVHDGEASDLEMEDLPVDEDGPGYAVLAVLVRARMKALPKPSKPPASHGPKGDRIGLDALQLLTELAQVANSPFRGTTGLPPSRAAVAALPTKRKKSDGPAPIYQVKVGLRGAKPPIWRRLEVPADISLASLHSVIQVAFDWDDSHLHVFETPYGDFGVPDRELGHRAEARVTLEQVAPAEKSKIRYLYDFGDNWEHEIVVEKVLDRDKAASYPRCTGGRRAGPPEDCGGVWGYAHLVEVLSDPTHPEHADQLEWLGLDHPADFDPAGFNKEAVTRALSALPLT